METSWEIHRLDEKARGLASAKMLSNGHGEIMVQDELSQEVMLPLLDLDTFQAWRPWGY